MAYDLEEQERLDTLRAWWERYGLLCISLVVALAVAILGWRAWQWYQGHQATQAMGYFEALQTAALEADADALARIKAASTTLRTTFPRSGYTARGVLIAAKALQDHNDLEGARAELAWLAQRDDALAPLARLRLASVLLAQGQYEAAWAQLHNPTAPFSALYADRRGDIFYAQGNMQHARQAWEQALRDMDDQAAAQIIRLKIDALGSQE